jgi:hypothetical protein
MMTIEESRRRELKMNVMLIFFFCIMLIGIAGSAYYYFEAKQVKSELQVSNDSLRVLSANIQSINNTLTLSKKELEQKTSNLDSLIRISIKDQNVAVLKPAIKKADNDKMLAAEYERQGFAKLKEGDLQAAKDYFNKSEQAYNGYHQVYEIWLLLYKSRQKLDDPEVKQQLLQQIDKDYSKFASIRTGTR